MSPFRYSVHVLLLGAMSFAAIHQNQFASKSSEHILLDTIPGRGAVNDTMLVDKPDVKASVDMELWRKHLEKGVASLIEKAANKGLSEGTYTVQIRFVVEKDGSITNITVLSDLGYGIVNEMEKIFSTAPRWTPAFLEGKPVRSRHTMPVTFSISEK